MTGDWLDRAALAAGEPISRGKILKLVAASALALGPLGALLRTSEARGATAQSGDCADCVLTYDAKYAENRRYCATRIARGLTVGVALPGAGPITMGIAAGCLGLEFDRWLGEYDLCRIPCKPQPRPNERTPSSSWVPPRTKAPPPPPPEEPKKPSKKKPKKPSPVTRTPKPPDPCKDCAAGGGQCCRSSASPTGFACCGKGHGACCHPSGDGCASGVTLCGP